MKKTLNRAENKDGLSWAFICVNPKDNKQLRASRAFSYHKGAPVSCVSLERGWGVKNTLEDCDLRLLIGKLRPGESKGS